MSMKPQGPCYLTGEEIHVDDRILFSGHPALVVAVMDRGEYSAGFLEKSWYEYDHGFLIRDETGTLYMHDEADEDIELVSRGAAAHDTYR